MSGDDHHAHAPEDPMVCIKVGIFFICVVAAIVLLAM